MDENLAIFYFFKTQNTSSPIMLDVGAHFGHTSIPFLSDSWTVHAFEPDNKNIKKLNTLLKNFPNLKVVHEALSDKIQNSVSFFSSHISSGISSLSPFHESHQESQTVKQNTLSNYCLGSVKHIDYLKIDTEGHDLFVLKGLDWQKYSPTVIQCEFENKKTISLNYNVNDLCDFLHDQNYHIILSKWQAINEYGEQHKWVEFIDYKKGQNFLDESAWGNILAFKSKVNSSDFLKFVHEAEKNKELFVKKYEEAQINYLKDQWEKISSKCKGQIYLYGAGKHSKKLIKIIEDNKLTKAIGIIDDQVTQKELSNLTISRLSDILLNDDDYIVLSTDTFQKEMLRKCLKQFDQKQIVDLYERDNV